MLRPDGYVKVLDFGIAKLTEQRRASDDHRVETTALPANATWVSVRHDALHVSGTGAWPEGGRSIGYLESGRSALRNRDR